MNLFMRIKQMKQYPEFSKDYPAIDGIAKGERPPKEEREKIEGGADYLPPENAIRSDVRKILDMDGGSFDSWYRSRSSSVRHLLNSLEIIITIPDLRYASEDSSHNLDANPALDNLYETLKRGLKYVEIIKKVREEQEE